jgi:hypothetical protein
MATERPTSAPASRDRSLQRLSRLNRWLVAGSVALTGLLTELTAHAFPAKPKAANGNSTRAHNRHRSPAHSGGSSTAKALRPPAQAPQSARPSSAGDEEASGSATPSHSSAPQATESQQAAEEPAQAHEAPPPEPEIHREPTPEPEAHAPVVSGGS